MANNNPEKSKRAWQVPVIVAVIGAAGVIVAAYIGNRTGLIEIFPPGSGPTASPGPSGSVVISPTDSASPTLSPRPSSEGYLNNIPQTPGFRQNSGAVVYNGIQYPESFQLNIPGAGSASYSYSLDGQWSAIKLLTEVPQGGNGGAIIGVTVSIDGHQASGGSFELGSPYAGQFSVAGIKKLTISFDAGASLSANTIIVAGNLSH